MRQFSLAVSAVFLSLLSGCPPEEEGTGDGGTQAPVKCGPSTCETGEVCCNESCGICTPPGGSCTEQFCSEPDACATVRCAAGTHCEVKACTSEPCSPSAECVADDVYGCELIDCRPGFICREDERGQGECIAEDTGVACGKNTCAAGEVCCNASCGICTPKGGACIQLACEEPAPTCDLACDTGYHCELEQVQCFAPPCDPVPTCVRDAECKGPVIDCAAPPDGCNYEGGGCVNGQWTCGKLVCHEEEPASCAVTLCPTNSYCDDISGKAQCIPLPSCSDVSCERGQHCELKEVQCVRAPCPPQPTCVDDVDTCSDPCATARCAKGTHCEAKQVVCIKAPCCPIAQCVADTKDVPCGKNTCTGGNVCCNASCGICTPKGGACIQLACE